MRLRFDLLRVDGADGGLAQLPGDDAFRRRAPVRARRMKVELVPGSPNYAIVDMRCQVRRRRRGPPKDSAATETDSSPVNADSACSPRWDRRERTSRSLCTGISGARSRASVAFWGATRTFCSSM